jgi:lipid-A-disaccharide synthase
VRDPLEPREVLLVAAEASSELYARRIIDECNNRNLNIKFYGIGSHAMEAMGFELAESSERMAVVGLFEVLAHWKVIMGAFKKLLVWAKNKKPKVALLLDYPDFNLRLAKKLDILKIPVLYFISPQVWAWRTGRVHLIKRIVSRMLVVFPFEKDFYEKFNVPVSFVGHPLLDEIKSARLVADSRRVEREQIGILDTDFLVGLLPGSRESELKYNFQVQLEAAELLSKKYPKAKFLILVAPTLTLDRVKELLPLDLKFSVRLIKDEPLKVMQMCDACVVASGTATLMMGLAETPMVIMYKMNSMTGFLARRLVKGQFFGMANLILGEQAVPELFQDAASGLNICAEIGRYIDDPTYKNSVKEKLSLIKTKLGSGGAVVRVVDELEKYLTL